MKKILLLILSALSFSWTTPKPMESIENYNVLMIHGAYGSNKDIIQTITDSLRDALVNEKPLFYKAFIYFAKCGVNGIRKLFTPYYAE